MAAELELNWLDDGMVEVSSLPLWGRKLAGGWWRWCGGCRLHENEKTSTGEYSTLFIEHVGAVSSDCS